MMFKKILVANRGEIAMRIIRACRELNIATAAIYAEQDSTGIYVKKADEAYQVGPGPVQGFLDMPQILALAQRIGADAIHPGYGFLSENAQFAHLCQASGVTFIGPSPQAIHLMGNKVQARGLAKKIGVPIVPGTEGRVARLDDALAFCRTVGYPVMVKASAGGGGRGLRVVRSDEELRSGMDTSAREALSAFGDGSLFIEKYLDAPHHIEFQILAAGQPLEIRQEDVPLQGHAIQCRINAEDPRNNFRPSTGTITAYLSPGGIGVRIDGAVYKDYTVPPYYDGLLAKLTVRGRTWEKTVSRMHRSLEEFVLRGVKTTIPFLQKIMKDPDFRAGRFDTSFLETHPDLFQYDDTLEPEDLVVAISAAIAAYEGL